MTAEWITVLLMAIGLIGAGIWATVTYFASNRYVDAVNETLEKVTKEFAELRDLVNTHMSNEAFYRVHIEEQKKTIEAANNTLQNVDGLFRTIDNKIKENPNFLKAM